MMNKQRKYFRDRFSCRLTWHWMVLLFLLPGLACGLSPDDSEQNSTLSNDPPIYIAEVENVWELWIPVNADGYYDETDRVMGVTAKMRYVLTFPRAGGSATIDKVYAPYKVDGVIDESRFSDDEIKAMMSRTDFPISRETVYTLTYVNQLESDSKFGYFEGDNPKAGENAPLSGSGAGFIHGIIRMDYEKTAGDARQIFYIDFMDGIVQTYRIVEPADPTWGR